jgi:hypothetical protein
MGGETAGDHARSAGCGSHLAQGAVMARKGDPQLNELEDSIIAFSRMASDDNMTSSSENGLIASTIDKVRSFLSQSATGEIDKYIEFLEDNLKIYISLLHLGGGERQRLKRVMDDISEHALALVAILSTLNPFEETVLELAIETERILDGMIGDRMIKASSTDGAKRVQLNSELRRNEFQEKLQYILEASNALKNTFTGTAQNKNRPLRVFIRRLLRDWAECGFPPPRWISDADHCDPMGIDPDPFCEMVHLIFDYMIIETRQGEAAREDSGTIDHVLRTAISGLKKIPTKAPNSRL